MKKVTILSSMILLLGTASCTKDKEEVLDTKENKEQVDEKKKEYVKPYHPEDDAKAKIDELVFEAEEENKNIILQIGGNWCIWCLRFHDFVQNNPELKKLVDDNYLYYHLNYSEENKNEDLMKFYGNPGDKYGYPVFVVLNQDGYQIHTQNSADFEYTGDEKGVYYDFDKVKEFFEKWKVKK